MNVDQATCLPNALADIVRDLAIQIQTEWRQAEYDEERFADLACEVLRAASLGDRLDYRDIIWWVASADELPYQARLDETFGQPPVTLFWNGRFQIDAIFWLTGTTAIHQHAFSGAFTVLHGSSIHSTFEFRLKRKFNSRLMTGDISLDRVELLERGAVRRIERAGALIHSLFHLDTPSVTVVVRTCSDPEAGPEYVYFPPSLAIDPSRVDPLRTRQLQIIDLLIRLRSPHLRDVAGEILLRCELHTAFLALSKLRIDSWGQAPYEELLSRLRRRYDTDIVDDLAAAIEEEGHRARVVALRRSVHDPEHRFFLALLLNLSDRETIHSMISSRFPSENPLSLAERWIVELSETEGMGLTFDASVLRLLRGCLQGHTPDEIIQQLRAEFAAEEIEDQVESIRTACSRIRNNVILRPLFNAARPR